MTIETVKKLMELFLKYAHTPGFLGETCHYMGYGAMLMASHIALEQGDRELSMAIDRLWDDTYRELFLQISREELNRQ